MSSIPLATPYTMIVAGQTGSGKTTFIYRLLTEGKEIHSTPFTRFVYVYSMSQPIFDKFSEAIPQLELYQGLPPDLEFNGDPAILILDDQMLEMRNDQRLAQYFTRMRHLNLSTIFVTQNFYFNSKYATTVSRNAQYVVLFPNVRDRSMMGTLGRQIFPEKPKFLISAFDDATKEPYGYLFLDMKPETDARLRVRSKISSSESPVIYRPS